MREIAVSKYKLSSIRNEIATGRLIGALNHETGHGFDQALSDISSSPKFIDAYNADVAKLPPNRRGLDIDYYLQPGRAGREEAFAEIFAHEMGEGAGSDPRKYFPGTAELVRYAIKSQERKETA